MYQRSANEKHIHHVSLLFKRLFWFLSTEQHVSMLNFDYITLRLAEVLAVCTSYLVRIITVYSEVSENKHLPCLNG